MVRAIEGQKMLHERINLLRLQLLMLWTTVLKHDGMRPVDKNEGTF